MSDNNPPVDNAIRTWPGPVVHLRRPEDRVTIILEPEPAPESPREFGELVLPARVRLASETPVCDAPAGRQISIAPAGRVLDVYELRSGWWRVTQAPIREMWVRAARLVY